jgi:hypothetical protein
MSAELDGYYAPLEKCSFAFSAGVVNLLLYPI